MKQKLTLILILSFCIYKSQTIKNGNFKLRFELLPTNPIKSKENSVYYNIQSFANDAIDFFPSYILNGNLHTKYYKNKTDYNLTKSINIVQNHPLFTSEWYQKYKPIANADIEININIGNLKMVNQYINNYAPTDPVKSNSSVITKFEFEFGFKIVDLVTNKVNFDTTYTLTETIIYPKDFYNVNQWLTPKDNRLPALPIFKSQIELDYNYNAFKPIFYIASKSILARNESKKMVGILNTRIGYNNDYETVEFTKVKYKTAEFAQMDSANVIFESILDSIQSNVKLENHKNWHTKNIKKLAFKLHQLNLDVLNNEKLKNMFLNENDKNEFNLRSRYNCVFSYLFIDDYENAHKLYKSVKDELLRINDNKLYKCEDIIDLEKIILREWIVYKNNKDFFSFE